MRRKLLIGLLAVCLGITGTYFATTTHHHQIVQGVKATKQTEMERKRENRAIAKRYAQVGFGWKNREWKCLESLWTRESRFDSAADNPRSSAYGIAQLLGETSNDPRIQVLRGLKYIFVRYETPCQALSFFHRRNWY
jgi:hypothetical protein